MRLVQTALIALVCLLAARCTGGSNRGEGSQLSFIASQLAELGQLPAPHGVSKANWEQLKERLATMLRYKLEQGDGRSASSVPDTDGSRCSASFDAGSSTLS